MPLRIKFALLVTFLFTGVALIIWFGVRPGYERAVIEERIQIMTEYQRGKAQSIDNMIDLWFVSLLEIENQMVDSANIEHIQTLFKGFTSVIPELLTLRIIEESTGEYIEMRSGSDVSNLKSEEINFQSSRFRDKLFLTFYDFHHKKFYVSNRFQAFNESFRISASFNTSSLEEILFSSNLGVDENEVLFMGNDYLYSAREIIPGFRPEYEPISRMQLVPIDGVETFVLSSPIRALEATYTIYLDKASIQKPVRNLFLSSIWMVGLSLITLYVISLILLRQLTRPVEQFLNDLHPFSEYDFSKPITPITIPELREVSRDMETIRQKMEHYQRINVEKVISGQEKNKMMMQYASDLIAVFDEMGQFTFKNNRFIKLFDNLAVKIPSNIDDFFAMDILIHSGDQKIQENRLKHLSIKKTSSEFIITSESNQKYFFDAHMVEIFDDKNICIGGQLMMYDLSHEREVDNLRNEMINTIAHELKNPLAGLMLTTEFLKSDKITESEKIELYDVIENSIKVMQKLIERFLTISALESANIDHQLEFTDLSVGLKNIIEHMKPQLLEKELALNLAIEEGLKPALVAPDLFADMVRNLLSNAIKYGPKSRPIDVNLLSENNQVILSVTDYGFGIDEKNRDQIFEKFYRINEYQSESGTGLGLSYVLEIIKKHKGNIKVESNKDIGSRFIVSIPYIFNENLEINA